MKKIVIILFTALLTTAIIGCSNPSGSSDGGSSSNSGTSGTSSTGGNGSGGSSSGSGMQKTAGSITYATTEISKTTSDSAFTNELTKTGDGAVSYTSSDTSAATVNADTGEVTIVAAGTTTITASVADSETYTYAKKTASYTLTVTQAGNGGGSSSGTDYIGTKAPTVPKVVGDIVFTDGSAMAYSDFAELDDLAKETKKSSAIALIFYKGTSLNSDVNGVANTKTSRTLGVGLKHGKKLAWSSLDATARNKNITTIQCTPSESEGTLTFSGDKNGSDNLEQIEDFDNVDDTTTASNYPAFYFGKNYNDVTGSNVSNTAYVDGWYLPSIAELSQIYACRADTTSGFDIDEASTALGGDKFDKNGYLSSSQHASISTYAYNLYFLNGSWNYSVKVETYDFVCCIHEFN